MELAVSKGLVLSRRDDRFTLPGLYCFASATDRHAWHYVPTQAQVQRNELGVPMVSLVETSVGVFLSFSALWQADLDALRDAINLHLSPDGTPVRISFAPIEEPQCNVLLGNGDGTFKLLSSSTTSGYPPYQALFNLTLEPDALRPVHLGLDGRPGWLAVEYRAALPGVQRLRARLHFNAEDFLPWLRDRLPKGAASPELIKEAVDLGLVEMAMAMDGAEAADLPPAYRAALLEAIASVLPGTVVQGSGDIEVELDYPTSEDVSAFADLGVLVAEASHNRIGGRHAAD